MRENQEFVVIDCTGLGDTGSDMAGDIKDVLRSALDAVKMCGTESDVKTFQSDVPSKNVSAVVKNSYNKFDTDGTNDDDSTQENILTVTNNDDPSNKNTLAGTLVVRQSNEKYRGFDALIFVMKYGVRYTKQEKDSVKMIKFIFGENVFQKWGILVFTYGDNFYSDSQITFEDWCREQTGDIKNLFEEVQHRCVIFDNKTVSLELQNSQRSTFSSLIDKVNEGNVGTYQIDGTAGPLKILDKYYTISERNPGHPHEELIELERMINEELAMFSPSKPDEYKKLLELGLNDIRKHQMARVPPKKALCILL
ncbi:unnamed protein product [Lymnaea stagnalis]|uniref:AIG1-type G domain-containing protein n=1 Tax=Lymnaea stagnalis TaxID=6523 RepID=A0AAV2IIY5_LYMST